LRSPAAASQSLGVPEDQALPVTLAGGSPTGNPIAYLVGTPQHGNLSGTPPGLLYQPNADYSGPDSFTYKVRDDMLDSDVATISVNVQPVNDPPVAFARQTGLLRNAIIPIILSGQDVEGGALTHSVLNPPTHGTLSGLPPNLAYHPSFNYVGRDSFQFKVNDGTADSQAATIGLAIVDNPVLSPPRFIENDLWRFEAIVTPGFHYILQASNDLQNWAPVDQLYGSTGTLLFTETVSSENPFRFYRIKLTLNYE